MGIFYNPPHPHIGGRQPLEPRKLPSSITAVPVADDPPFSSRSSRWTIIYSWQPEFPFQQEITLFPWESLDNPPLTSRNLLWPIMQAWQVETPIIKGRNLPPGIPSVSVDTPLLPPINVNLSSILTAWQPGIGPPTPRGAVATAISTKRLFLLIGVGK